MIFAGFSVGAASYPVGVQFEKKNTNFEADDGTIRVRGIGVPRRVHVYKFKRLTNTQKILLEIALMSTTHGEWGVNVIQFTDDENTVWSGRLWIAKLKFTQKLGRYWSATVPMRIEGGYSL